MKFVVYKTSTGEIMRSVDCPESVAALQAGDGEAILGGDGQDDIHYVLDNQIVERPTTPATPDTLTVPADGVTPITISNLVNPTAVQVRGPEDDEFEVADTVLELTFEVAGSYVLTLDAGFPYMPTEITVDAT